MSFLAFLIVWATLPEESEARRRSYSRSRSSRSYSRRSSSSSRSRSRSSWGSSSYRSKGGSFGSRSTRNLASSSRSSSRSGGSRNSSSRSSSRSNQYKSTSNKYKSSSSKYSTRHSSRPYRSHSSYDRDYRNYRRPRYKSRGSWWTRNSSYKQRWRSNSSYRWRFRSRYYNDSYSVGVWDIYFLSHANDLFWYHHWQDRSIRNALYQQNILEDAELRRLESRVQELEQQGIARNADYLPDGVGPEDAYSRDYIRSVAYEEEEGGVGFIIFMSILVGAVVAYFAFFRKY